MKKIILICLIIGTVGVGNLYTITRVSAQTTGSPTDYTVLAPLPGTTNGVCDPSIKDNPACKTTLEKYLPAVFNLLIGLSAVAAVLMIVIGGFQYMSSDAIQGKSAGKERIQNAIKGLVLVIGAWLILFTINPNLLTINLNIDSVTTTSPPGGGTLAGSSVDSGSVSTGSIMTTDQIAASNTVRASLESKGIVTYANPCTGPGQTTGCVDLNGLQSVSQDGIVALKYGCGTTCALIITGGTEGGHNGGTSHTDGVALDVRHDAGLDSYIDLISKNNPPVEIKGYGTQYTGKVNGKDVTFLNEGNHWHVTFH